jgi:XPB/Ssl2-like helicase family protein/WYL domain-containing protein
VKLAQWLGTRTPEQLATLLAARPDATVPPVPRHLAELADRLATFHSVASAVQQLPQPAIQVIEVLQLIGSAGATRAALAGWLGRSPDDPALAGIVALLGDWALVWPQDERLHAVDPLYGAFRYPLRLGPPAAALLSRYPSDQLRRIARTLGAPLAHRKQDLLAGVMEQLGDPDRVRALVATSDAGTRAQLCKLAEDGPETHDPVWYGYHHRDPGLRWAVERGMVVTDSLGASQLVREVAVALRGPGWHAPFTPDRPDPALIEVDTAAVAREAAAAGSAAVEQLTSLLEAVAAAPVALLKAGGLGVKELRRLARTAGLDEGAARLWLELAYEAALVTPVRDRSGTGLLLPTPEYDGWAGSEPAERLAALLPVWADLPAGPPLEIEPKPAPALVRDHIGQLAVAIRHRLLRLAGELPPGRGVTDPAGLTDVVAWHAPLLVGGLPIDRLVLAGWREAQLVGVVALGALSPLGRALQSASSVDIFTACRTLLPSATEQAVFQADLTAVVPGTPARELARLLDASADRESRGGAMTWRFSAGSVRRALDVGYGADELIGSLRARAVGGALPQPLTYLVGDVARRHGAVRVRAVACVVRVEDPALAAEIAGARALRSLRLSVVAPTVLGSTEPVAGTLAALRAAGYAPVAESAGGAVELERVEQRRASRPKPTARRRTPPAPEAPVDPARLAGMLLAAPVPAPRVPRLSEPGFAKPDLEAELEDLAGHLGPGERRLLAHAIETAHPVTIGYTNAQGNHSTRVIDSAELDGHQLVAWCHLREDERVFSLHRIDSVAPAG